MMAAWATELVLITAKDIGIAPPGVKWAKGSAHRVSGLPLPADYVATFLIFGTLAVISDASPAANRFATWAAWGYVLASLLSIVNPTNPLKSGQNPAPTGTGTGGQ
jgi:hypothetical protein